MQTEENPIFIEAFVSRASAAIVIQNYITTQPQRKKSLSHSFDTPSLRPSNITFSERLPDSSRRMDTPRIVWECSPAVGLGRVPHKVKLKDKFLLPQAEHMGGEGSFCLCRQASPAMSQHPETNLKKT
jgi:hypothetical protein